MKRIWAQRGRMYWAALGAVCLLMGASIASENTYDHLESEVKSQFIRRFTEYIEWPQSSYPDTSSVFTICSVGNGSLLPYLLRNMNGLEVQGRASRVKQLELSDDMRGCHVLYVAPSLKNRAEKLIQNLGTAPILTIGDSEGYEEKGVIINLFVEGTHIRFTINSQAAKEKNLKVSAKLLVLAKPRKG